MEDDGTHKTLATLIDPELSSQGYAYFRYSYREFARVFHIHKFKCPHKIPQPNCIYIQHNNYVQHNYIDLLYISQGNYKLCANLNLNFMQENIYTNFLYGYVWFTIQMYMYKILSDYMDCCKSVESRYVQCTIQVNGQTTLTLHPSIKQYTYLQYNHIYIYTWSNYVGHIYIHLSSKTTLTEHTSQLEHLSSYATS